MCSKGFFNPSAPHLCGLLVTVSALVQKGLLWVFFVSCGRVLPNHFNDEELDLGGELQRQSLNDSSEIPWQEVCTISLTYCLNLNELSSHFWLFFPLCADAVAERGTRRWPESLCHLSDPPHQTECPHHPWQPGLHEEVFHSVLHKICKVSYQHTQFTQVIP